MSRVQAALAVTFAAGALTHPTFRASDASAPKAFGVKNGRSISDGLTPEQRSLLTDLFQSIGCGVWVHETAGDSAHSYRRNDGNTDVKVEMCNKKFETYVCTIDYRGKRILELHDPLLIRPIYDAIRANGRVQEKSSRECPLK